MLPASQKNALIQKVQSGSAFKSFVVRTVDTFTVSPTTWESPSECAWSLWCVRQVGFALSLLSKFVGSYCILLVLAFFSFVLLNLHKFYEFVGSFDWNWLTLVVLRDEELEQLLTRRFVGGGKQFLQSMISPSL